MYIYIYIYISIHIFTYICRRKIVTQDKNECITVRNFIYHTKKGLAPTNVKDSHHYVKKTKRKPYPNSRNDIVTMEKAVIYQKKVNF